MIAGYELDFLENSSISGDWLGFLYPKSSTLDEFSKIGLGHGPILQKN